MADFDLHMQRQFAVEVVERLRADGFIAYWAGGCVRDQILAVVPGDYDVATNAKPDEIRRVFGRKHTLAIGAAYGVIVVLGPPGAGQVEVTTFRSDAEYLDGRHPSRVVFSSPEEDAQRRDFTINGMFYDPLADQVIDFVGGQDDLRRGIIRAIGQPRSRFAEDKLRMLRAVRFAARFQFELDADTMAAIRDMAPQLTVVSAERIAAEMESMLIDQHRARAMNMLLETGLLEVVLPELGARGEGRGASAEGLGDRGQGTGDGKRPAEDRVQQANSPLSPCGRGAGGEGARDRGEGRGTRDDRNTWEHTLRILDGLRLPTFALCLAVLLDEIGEEQIAEQVGRRWRLARKDFERAGWLIANKNVLTGARQLPWSQLQPLLVHEGIFESLSWGDALAAVGELDPLELAFCTERLALPPEQLNPPPLVTGDDLMALGIPPGKRYSQLLRKIRAAQLDGQVKNKAEALALARSE